ncbi:MAG: hypothetical protein WD941_01175 [Opitutus sp.]
MKAAARRAARLGSRQERIGPRERRERLARESDSDPAASATTAGIEAAGMPAAADEGDVAVRVLGHGFDRNFAEFVARVAARLGICGWIRIGSGEAVIRAAGSEEHLAGLICELRDRAPVDTSVRGFELERIDALPPLPADGFIALLETAPPPEEPVTTGVNVAAVEEAFV